MLAFRCGSAVSCGRCLTWMLRLFSLSHHKVTRRVAFGATTWVPRSSGSTRRPRARVQNIRLASTQIRGPTSTTRVSPEKPPCPSPRGQGSIIFQACMCVCVSSCREVLRFELCPVLTCPFTSEQAPERLLLFTAAWDWLVVVRVPFSFVTSWLEGPSAILSS